MTESVSKKWSEIPAPPKAVEKTLTRRALHTRYCIDYVHQQKTTEASACVIGTAHRVRIEQRELSDCCGRVIRLNRSLRGGQGRKI